MVQYNTVNVKLSNLQPNKLNLQKKKKKKKWNWSNFKSCMKFGWKF